MGTIETASGPGDTVDISGNSPSRDVTAADTTVKPILLLQPSVGAYGNGVTVMSANYGDSNTDEGIIEQADIMPVHPQNKTAINDKTTAFDTGDHLTAKEHVKGKTYWLKGSSISATRGDKLYCSGSGLVSKQTAHTATPLAHQTWICARTVASQTYVQGTYVGLTTMFTSN